MPLPWNLLKLSARVLFWTAFGIAIAFFLVVAIYRSRIFGQIFCGVLGTLIVGNYLYWCCFAPDRRKMRWKKNL